MGELNAKEFKKALSCFATGVTVISAVDHHGKPLGITVNSFNSLSLDPFLILYSLEKKSNLHETLVQAKQFNVNILSQAQAYISKHFAFGDKYDWSAISYISGENQCPAIEHTAAILECEHYTQYDGGDHTIIVGKVVKATTNEAFPLVYYQGDYTGLDK